MRRHAVADGWALDVGAGPGRFTGLLATAEARAVGLDLSRRMLSHGAGEVRAPDPAPRSIVGDALRPPLLPGAFRAVALLGNPLGFAGTDSSRMLETSIDLVSPGGTLLLELAPGPGERSRYLTRLPPGAVGRLLRAPVAAVAPRVLREGFVRSESGRRSHAAFARLSPAPLVRRLQAVGFTVRETVAVAPALGAAPTRLTAVRSDPIAWRRLVELEEQLGRRPDRWDDAAAVLVAAVRPAVGVDLVHDPAPAATSAGPDGGRTRTIK